MKKVRVLVSLSLMVGFVFASGAVNAADKVTFSADWILYGKHAPFVVAVKKGFYKKHDLEVVITRGYGSGDTIKRVGAKTSDFGIADHGSLIVARARGTKVKGVGILVATSLNTIFTLKKNNIRTPRDLKGKIIGAPARDTARTIFPAFARINGLDPDKDVKWLDMTGAARLSSLLTGKVDAFSGFGTATPTFVAGAKKVGAEIVEIKYAEWGLDTYSTSLLSHDESLKDNPDRVKRFVAATLQAWAWSRKHPDEATKIFRERSPETSPTLALAHLKIAMDVLVDEHVKKHGLGTYNRAKMKTTAEVIAKYQRIPLVPLDDHYTNAYLPNPPIMP